MSENPVFDSNNTLGDGIAKLSRSKLVALAADLCVIAFKERDEHGYRGGIRPDNISIGADSSIAIGPAENQDKDKCSKPELEYISPEFFWSGKAGSQADVYAIGLMLYVGVTGGKLPFVTDGSDADSAEAFRKRMNGDKIKVPASVGKKFKAIIEQATAFSASDRYENTLQLAEELKSLLAKPDAEAVSKAAMDAFGKPESELSDVEKMMLGIITSAALSDDLADVPLEEQEEDEDEEEIEVEIEELPPEPDEPEDAESIEVEIEELPPEPEEPEDVESIEVEIEELPPEADTEVIVEEAAPVEEAAAIEAAFVEEAVAEPEKAEEVLKEIEPIEVPAFVNTPKKTPASTTPKHTNTKKKPKSFIVIIALCAVLAIAAVIYNNTSGKNADGVSRTMPPINYITPEPTKEPVESEAPVESEEPVESEAPVESEEPVKKESTYQVFTENISWDAAEQKCKDMGGHLVAINDEEEFNKVCELLNGTNAKYVWIGCYRSSAGNLTWTNGDDIEYYNWAANEPSLTDSYDGASEDYIMLVRQPDWSWKYNDSRINPMASYSYYYSGRIAYVCEISE